MAGWRSPTVGGQGTGSPCTHSTLTTIWRRSRSAAASTEGQLEGSCWNGHLRHRQALGAGGASSSSAPPRHRAVRRDTQVTCPGMTVVGAPALRRQLLSSTPRGWTMTSIVVGETSARCHAPRGRRCATVRIFRRFDPACGPLPPGGATRPGSWRSCARWTATLRKPAGSSRPRCRTATRSPTLPSLCSTPRSSSARAAISCSTRRGSPRPSAAS